MTPFYCTVCSDLFVSSTELIQHLIEHSDMNTAMKRQPPVSEIMCDFFVFFFLSIDLHLRKVSERNSVFNVSFSFYF